MRISDWSSDVCSSDLEGRGIFGGVAHDLDMAEALGLERLSDRPDAAVHHVAGRDDVGAGARLIQRLSHQYLDRLVVENIARAVDQPVLPMTGIDRKRVESGKSGSVSVNIGGRGSIQK